MGSQSAHTSLRRPPIDQDNNKLVMIAIYKQ